MKKTYNIWDLLIDFREFYQYWVDKEDQFDKVWWSSSWYCWDESCVCWELEHLKESDPSLKIRLVPWYKRVFRLSHRDKYIYIIVWFVIWLIF